MPAQSEIRQVGSPNRNRAFLSQLRDARRIDRRDRLGESRHALSRRRSGKVDVLFHGHGNAVKIPDVGAASEGAISFIGRRQGLVRHNVGDGIEMSIHRLDAF